MYVLYRKFIFICYYVNEVIVLHAEKILIIEDDMDIRSAVRILLESEGYLVEEADNGIKGIDMVDDKCSLVILDIMMPQLSGIETCKRIRAKSYIPILFLTAKSSDTDKLLGLSSGGDDYIVKPFSYIELIARVRALLRRNTIYNQNTKRCIREEWIRKSGIEVNTQKNHVISHGRQVFLTDTEYKILLLLMTNMNKIFSVENIFESVWEESYIYSSSNTVMVHMKNLRAKIEEEQSPKVIKTVWGKGYKFEA